MKRRKRQVRLLYDMQTLIINLIGANFPKQWYLKSLCVIRNKLTELGE